MWDEVCEITYREMCKAIIAECKYCPMKGVKAKMHGHHMEACISERNALRM